MERRGMEGLCGKESNIDTGEFGAFRAECRIDQFGANERKMNINR